MRLQSAGAALIVVAAVAFGHALQAQGSRSTAEMFREWCAVCHGEDGRGQPRDRPVKTEPMDLTDCRIATTETDVDWELVVTHGGPIAGRSSDMPGFEMLGREVILDLVRYTKSFCRDPRWPAGNLNVPRAIFTTKAFPESEAVLQPMVTHGAPTTLRTSYEMSFARRVGRRGQLEIGLPAETVDWVSGLVSGIGDVRLEGKYALYASAPQSVIVSVGLEASFPTGSRRWGFGEGTAVLEPYAALGAIWRDLVLQADLHVLLPAKKFPTEPVRHLTYSGAVLRPLSTSPTAWTIGAELTGTDRNLSITPEVLKGLTRTGSLSAAFGVRLSLTNPHPYNADVTRWSGYLLWDYMEPLRSRR